MTPVKLTLAWITAIFAVGAGFFSFMQFAYYAFLGADPSSPNDVAPMAMAVGFASCLLFAGIGILTGRRLLMHYRATAD